MRWAVVLLSGCSSILGIDNFRLDDAGVGGEFCAGPDGWKICLPVAPQEPYALSSALNLRTGDTDGNGANAECLKTIPTSWTLGGQSSACIVVASDVLIKADILVSGQRPLVIVASRSITIEGLLDVSSHGLGSRGAASPSNECRAPSPPASDSGNGAGGGAGASFISMGGNGGRGSANLPGAVAAPTSNKPTTLRAGCNGEEGGLGTTTTAASGGAGGGAVYLVAGDMINLVAGGVTVNGAGGQGGPALAGGGGGGSGGMIVLHATTITGTNGTLTASGGGGGGAGNATSSGMPGKDPLPKNPSDTAAGGLGASGAGAGGNGFSINSAVGNGRDVTAGSSGGGGGGGGGSGLIMTNVPPIGITTSPDRSAF